MISYEKRGYLNSEFRLFHLTDIHSQDYDYHYHEFDKVIIFISGKVDYTIEGKTYCLNPYDIVLVNHHHIHCPVVDSTVPYERIIVYLSPSFITSFCTLEYDLSQCFQKAEAEHSSVLRIHSLKQSTLFQVITNLEKACSEQGYANDLYCQVLFLEFMIHLNRAANSQNIEYMKTTQGNPKVADMITYMNDHLTEDLNINQLASRFYLSKYYMMRLFKEETGYSISAYIQNKRLLLAKDMLSQDTPITLVCFECGFRNYSSFSRAYRRYFGETPRESRQSNSEKNN